ncbi:MAG: DUF308 domain-containing protein [Candidatus Micrarchaeia archaeon]
MRAYKREPGTSLLFAYGIAREGGESMVKKKMTSDETMGKAGVAIGIAGLLFFLFGLMLFLNPATTLSSTVFVLGLLLVIGALFQMYEGLFVCKGAEFSGFLVIMGLLTGFVGMVMLLSPDAVTGGIIFAIGMVAFLLAIIAIAAGVWQIVYAIKKGKKRWLPLVGGIIYALLGLFMLFHPFVAALAMVSLVGFFACVYGAILIAFACSIKEIMSI